MKNMNEKGGNSIPILSFNDKRFFVFSTILSFFFFCFFFSLSFSLIQNALFQNPNSRKNKERSHGLTEKIEPICFVSLNFHGWIEMMDSVFRDKRRKEKRKRDRTKKRKRYLEKFIFLFFFFFFIPQ